MGCVVLFGLLIVGVLVIMAAVIGGKSNEREAARVAYQTSLEMLKRDPANADLRQETLRLGREYAHLVRQRRGVALFDEMALMNDLSAATAAAAQPKPQLPALVRSVESRLSSLSDLHAKGLIDDAEHAARRREILSDV